MGMDVGNNGKGSGRRTLSEINVVPLVDIMLVLLIIFMVTAPMIEQGVEVNLPQAETVEITPDEGKSMIVINANSEIHLGETLVDIEELEDKVRFNVKIQREKVVYLYADKDLRYEIVARVMSILKVAGVESIGMVTEPLTQDAKGKR